MTEDSDDVVFAHLLDRVEQGDPEARELLGALHNRRSAEWQDLQDRAGLQRGTAVDVGPMAATEMAHYDVITKEITGTSAPAGRCPLDGVEMTLRYVASERRVRGVCPLHPPDELFEP
jgi:hypothetical protein